MLSQEAREKTESERQKSFKRCLLSELVIAVGNWVSVLLKTFKETVPTPPQNCSTRTDACGIPISPCATISPRKMKSPILPEQAPLVLEKALKNSGKSRFATVSIGTVQHSCC